VLLVANELSTATVWGMSILGRGTLALSALLALVAALPAIGADSYQSATLVFDQQTPGSSSGMSLAIDYVNPSDAQAKPYAVSKTVIALPPGTTFNHRAVERCEATDQELMLRGAEACPAGSAVGSGELDLDTGIDGPGRVLANDVTMLNNDGELILVLEPKDGPPAKIVARSVIEGSTITTEVKPIPGGPPDGYTAVKRVRLAIPSHGSGSGSYITTPSTCPASGRWTTAITFEYRAAASQTVRTDSPCSFAAVGAPARRPVEDSEPPDIAVHGLRRRCVRTGFRLAVRVQDRQSGVRSVHVLRDGRQVFRTDRSHFARRINTGRLRPGRHSLTIAAVDRSGNRGTHRSHFRRCA
jgi:hypothetical protein